VTPLGWLFLTVSWAGLSVVTLWCFVKIWQAPFDSQEDPPQVPFE
jgi:hypothetical protein